MSGPLTTGFQGVVNNQPAPAVEGDFYGANPRASILGGAGQFVAPIGGLLVGHFAWFNQATGQVSQGYVAGAEIGFVRRDNQTVIVNFLAPASMLIEQGFDLTGYNQGDFWARFAGGATPGQTVYADPTTGAAIAAASGGLIAASVTASGGFSGTGSAGCTAATATSTGTSVAITAVTGFIAPGDTLTDGVTPAVVVSQSSGPTGGAGTYIVTVDPSWVAAAITGVSNTLDVTAVAFGKVEVGSVISGTGVTGATVTGQQSGTPGGIGLYTISGGQQNFASTATLVATDDILTVTAVGSGALAVGNIIAGSGVTGGTQILAQLSGVAGGIGTYQISPSQKFPSTTVTVGAVATKWIVNSVAAAGELATISSWG